MIMLLERINIDKMNGKKKKKMSSRAHVMELKNPISFVTEVITLHTYKYMYFYMYIYQVYMYIENVYIEIQ